MEVQEETVLSLPSHITELTLPLLSFTFTSPLYIIIQSGLKCAAVNQFNKSLQISKLCIKI